MVKGHFKRLPRINTAPMPIVLSIGIPTPPHHLYLLLKVRTQNRLVSDLTRPETQRELNLVYQLHVQ
jgi:hypothetical protein